MDKIWDNGFRQITSSTKPINTPDDLRGFKIRVPVSPLWTSMFKAFEASPTSINANEMYTALQTKVVDGQENPLAVISTFQALRSPEVLLADEPHVGRVLVPRQPPRLGTAASRMFAPSSPSTSTPQREKEREDVAKLNASLQQELAAKGMVFNQPDPAPFRDKLRKAGFYAEWKGKYGDEAWAILEKSVGTLA